MIQPWLGDVQEALHDSPDFQRLAIKGKIREIRTTSKGIRSLEVGSFSFITTTVPRITLVSYKNKQYGIIVDKEVFKYQGSEKPVSVGKLKGGNSDDAHHNKPVERVRNSQRSSDGLSKSKSRQHKEPNRGKKRDSVKRQPPGGSRLLRYLWRRH